MLYQTNYKKESHIPSGDWVVYCDRCWGIITYIERQGKESVKYAKENENVCLYCRKKERNGTPFAP